MSGGIIEKSLQPLGHNTIQDATYGFLERTRHIFSNTMNGFDINSINKNNNMGESGRHREPVDRPSDKDRVPRDKVVANYKLDLRQPWQRSLMRELELSAEDKLEQSMFQYNSDKLLLGRAESGDFAVPYDGDEWSVSTDTSATIPLKAQIIHRIFPFDNTPLFTDEDEEDGTSFMTNNGEMAIDNTVTQSPRSVLQDPSEAAKYRSVADAREELIQPEMNHETSDKYMVTKTKEDSGKSNQKLPDVLNRSRALPEYMHKTKQWLELEADEETDNAFIDPVASNSAACFCFGANILDYWLPPVDKSRRRPVYGRHARLERVDENGETAGAKDALVFETRQHESDQITLVDDVPRGASL